MGSDENVELQAERRAVMAVLAETDADEIAAHLRALGKLPASQELREPECGLLMLRGRIGGHGAAFNVGEVTVTRCAVRLETAEVGYGHVLGRQHAKARLVALCDALAQTLEHRDALRRLVVEPIRARLREADALSAQRTRRHQGRILHPGARGGCGVTATTFNRASDVFAAQATFRAIMAATARPGIKVLVDGVVAVAPLSATVAAVAKALCDQDTPVWLDGALSTAPAVAAWLRFQTQCPIVEEPAAAAFALVADPLRMPSFEAFNLGTAEYPDRSATLVLAVDNFESGPPVALAGPGIRERQVLRAAPLPPDMTSRIAANRALFPRGVDLLLVSATAMVALPRSVRIAGA